MGYTSWSEDFYNDRAAARAKTGKSAFAYHDAIKHAPRADQKCHTEMDPKGVTRESRDSVEHPESLAIGVVLDQTGSMASTPRVMQKALPELMKGLVDEGVVEHPQVLFGAVGDATNGEAAPVQMGQFESGIEMDEDLGKIFMEGCGGGSYQESYELVLYYFARHTATDCFEKRGTKGRLFIVGDEHAYPEVSAAQIKTLFGDDVQGDIPLETIVKECQEKWDVYFLIPARTSHGRDPELRAYWVNLLGGSEFVIGMDDESQVCAAIKGAIKGDAPSTSVATSRNVRL